MEDMPKPPGGETKKSEEDDDDDEAQLRKRRTLSESIISWMEGQDQKKEDSKEDAEDEEDEDESEEDDKTLSGKFHRNLKKLWPDIVEKPQDQDDVSGSSEIPKEGPLEGEGEATNPDFSMDYEVPPLPSPEESAVEPAPSEITERISEVESTLEDIESVPPVETETVTPPVVEAEPTPLPVEEEHSPEDTPLPEETSTETPDIIPMARPEAPASVISGGGVGGGSEIPRLQPRGGETNQDLPEKRGTRAALIAFLASEVFSRRRDRKIRKEAGKQQKEIELLRKKQRALESDRSNRRSAADRLKDDTNNQEILRQPKPVGINEIAPKQANLLNTPRGPEEFTPIAASELHPEHNRELTVHDSRETTPKQVLAQAEVAADKNIPIETLYERRQEIKDEEGDFAAISARYRKDYQPTGASPVSNVLQSPEFDQARRLAYQADNPAARQTPDPSSSYKNAAKTGFGLAVLFIIILMLILFLR